MDDRDVDKLSSSLPETLHAHIIRPDDPYGRSDEASWSAQDRHLVQQQASRFTSQSISSLTPATFPNSHGSRGESSHDRLVSPDIEKSGYSSQRIQNTSAGRRGGAAADFAHPPRAWLIPPGNRIPGSEPPFYHHNPIHSYTYPPPLPSQYHVSSPSTFQARACVSSSSHAARRPGGGSRAPEGNQKEDDDDFEQTREVTSLDHAHQQDIHLGRYSTPQQRPAPDPSFFPRDVTGSRENSPYLCSAPHLYDDSGHLQPTSHYLESNIIRHHSLPSQRWEERSHSGSSSNRHTPSTLVDDRPFQRASSYSLPPIRNIIQSPYSDRGPQSSSHGLLDQTPDSLPAEASVEDRESSNERPTYRRGKRKRTDTQDERKTKVARKIYIACNFCRGRKLRCDGTKPSCANCSTRKLDCVYKDQPRRRGPGKAPKGSRIKKSEGKGRRRTSSKATTSEVDREEFGQPSTTTLPDRHVFELPMMLPGHGHPHLSELEAVYAPPPYTDRPSASNVHREGLEPIPHYQFTSGVFDQGTLRPLWGRDEEDSGSAESGHALPPLSQKDDTDEELTN